MKNKKILVAAQHFGATNATAPVVKELIKRNYDVTVLAHNQAEKGYPNKDIQCETTEKYRVKNELSNFSKEKMYKILEKISPDYILTGSSTEREHNGLEKSLIIAGNEMKISTSMLVDMWGEAEFRFKDYDKGNLIIPNKVFVIDDYHKKLVGEQGIPQSNIYVTGNPDFDDTLKQAEEFTYVQRNSTLARFGEINTPFVLGYIGNAFKIHSEQEGRGYWDLDNFKALNKSLDKNKDVTILSTIHGRMPEEEKQEVKDFLKKYGNERFIFLEQGGGFAQTDLIYISDIVATPFSTDGIKAAIIGKPVISMQGKENKERLVTNSYGITYRIDDYTQLDKVIESTLKDKNNFYKLCPNLEGFEPDGKSVERIIEQIH